MQEAPKESNNTPLPPAELETRSVLEEKRVSENRSERSDRSRKHKHHHHHKRHHKHHKDDRERGHHKHRSHRRSRKSRSRSRSRSEESSYRSRSRSISEMKRRHRERSREHKKEKTANVVPFDNSPLPNRVPKNIFETEFPEKVESDKGAMVFAFAGEEKPDQPQQQPANTIQILLNQPITTLEQSKITVEEHPVIHAEEEKKTKEEEPEVQRRERLNSQEEIDRRQSYFKMVEREREQCEGSKGDNKAFDESPTGTEVSDKSMTCIQRIKPGRVSPVHPSWDDSNGYLKIRAGDTLRNYTVTSVLGKGVFGSVVKCVENASQEEVAMKIIRSKDVYQASGEKELKVLNMLNDADPYGMVYYLYKNYIDRKNIVKVLDSFTYQNHLCFAMECFDMNLRDTFPKQTKAPVTLSTIQLYARELLRSLYFIKKKGLIHADSTIF